MEGGYRPFALHRRVQYFSLQNIRLSCFFTHRLCHHEFCTLEKFTRTATIYGEDETT